MRFRQQRTDDAEDSASSRSPQCCANRVGVYADGATTADVCRRHGVSEQTFYRWTAKYGGMGASDAAKLNGLEDEIRRPKKLLVKAMLDGRELQRPLLG